MQKKNKIKIMDEKNLNRVSLHAVFLSQVRREWEGSVYYALSFVVQGEGGVTEFVDLSSKAPLDEAMVTKFSDLVSGQVKDGDLILEQGYYKRKPTMKLVGLS